MKKNKKKQTVLKLKPNQESSLIDSYIPCCRFIHTMRVGCTGVENANEYYRVNICATLLQNAFILKDLI